MRWQATADDITPTRRFKDLIERLHHFLPKAKPDCLWGKSSCRMFLEISFFVLSDGAMAWCALAQGEFWGREGPRAR